MSRIGKLPIAVPNGTTVSVDGQTIKAKGPKGELSFTVVDVITPKLEGSELTLTPRADIMKSAESAIEAAKARGKRPPTLAQALDPVARTQWGTMRARAANLVEGVANGYSRTLELVGVGYRAQMKGNSLSLALGFSHDVDFPTPAGIKIETPKPTEIIISGIDKQLVGETAAKIRSYRPPEPYKGKGVKYEGEYIFRKEGKKK